MRNKNAKVSDPNSFVTNKGDPIRVIYDSKIKPDGAIEVVPVGQENIQEFIQSFADQTDMNYILKQMALGNTEVLNQGQAFYGDFTKTPKTMAEALQIEIDAQRAWYDLPVDQRAEFDHDFTKWLVSAGTDEWNSKMGFSSEESKVESDAKESVSE